MRTTKEINALQMELGALVRECRMICDFATVRNRPLTKSECAKVNNLHAYINVLDGRICDKFRELSNAAFMRTYAKHK